MSVKKYRVYCNDEAKTVTGWLETEPTTCFNDNTHTIDTAQTVMTDIQHAQTVTLSQTNEDVQTQGTFFLHTITITVGPKETKTIPMNFGLDVNMFAVRFHITQAFIGDRWSAHIDKDTVIGTVSATATDTSVISMNSVSVSYIKPGYFISIAGGEYIRVLSKTTDTLTLTSNVTAAIGDVVMLTYFMVKDKENSTAGNHELGTSIFGSFKILKTQNAAITYTNISNSHKTILVDIETTF